MTQLLTLALAALGVWLCLQLPHQPALIVPAVACLLLAFVLRPRLGRAPRKFVLPREKARAFHRIVDEIASAAGAPVFDLVVISLEPTAATARRGFRRKRVLFLGLPLWVALDWPERVVLIAHESGHYVNGDVRSGFLVGTSLHTLRTWMRILTPTRPTRRFAQGLVRALVRLPLLIVARTLRRLLLRLSARRSRLAEYRADAVGARVGGVSAAEGTLDKLLTAPDSMRAITDAALWRGDVDLWTAQRNLLDQLSERRRAKLRKLDEISTPDRLSSHPNITRRLAYLRAVAPDSATPIAFDVQLLADADAEMAAVLRQMDHYVRESVRARLTPAQIEAGMGGAGSS